MSKNISSERFNADPYNTDIGWPKNIALLGASLIAITTLIIGILALLHSQKALTLDALSSISEQAAVVMVVTGSVLLAAVTVASLFMYWKTKSTRSHSRELNQSIANPKKEKKKIKASSKEPIHSGAMQIPKEVTIDVKESKTSSSAPNTLIHGRCILASKIAAPGFYAALQEYVARLSNVIVLVDAITSRIDHNRCLVIKNLMDSNPDDCVLYVVLSNKGNWTAEKAHREIAELFKDTIHPQNIITTTFVATYSNTGINDTADILVEKQEELLAAIALAARKK